MTDRDLSPAARRRYLAERDIEAVRRQVADGELDPETAELLIRRYRSEIELLEPDAAEAIGTGESATTQVSRSRRVVGTLLLIAVFAGVSVTAYYAIRPRDGGFITGDVESAVDLSEVTNDQMGAVIAANPDVPQIAAMRLSLADRYFDEGSFSSALPHYLGALEGTLDSTRRARGLARIGWMSYLSGAEDIAEAYLLEALDIDPDYRETQLFLGLIRLYQGDGSGALAHLEPLLAGEDLPGDTRRLIEDAVAEARALADAESANDGTPE